MVLFFMLLFVYRYVHTFTPSATAAAVPMQSQMPQPSESRAPALAAGDHSIASRDNFGWLTFIAKPLYLALRFLYSHGVGNWGWTIIPEGKGVLCPKSIALISRARTLAVIATHA